jgi:hypothetical protein
VSRRGYSAVRATFAHAPDVNVGGERGIRTPGTLSGTVVFKTVHGWEGHRLLPTHPNKIGRFLHMTWALTGAYRHKDTDKKRTVKL